MVRPGPPARARPRPRSPFHPSPICFPPTWPIPTRRPTRCPLPPPDPPRMVSLRPPCPRHGCSPSMVRGCACTIATERLPSRDVRISLLYSRPPLVVAALVMTIGLLAATAAVAGLAGPSHLGIRALTEQLVLMQATVGTNDSTTTTTAAATRACTSTPLQPLCPAHGSLDERSLYQHQSGNDETWAPHSTFQRLARTILSLASHDNRRTRRSGRAGAAVDDAIAKRLVVDANGADAA